MLGLAILFGLAVWLIITIFAIIIGYKTGKKTGAFFGFMLTMGGWIVYWIAEYHYIQYKVNHLCETEGGVTVYITPEEWRKMIGEEEWGALQRYGRPLNARLNGISNKIINGIEYIPVDRVNKNMIRYSDWEDVGSFTSKKTSLLINESNQQILMRYVLFSTGTGAWLAGGSPKFWINNVDSCSEEIDSQAYEVIHQYSNSTLGVRYE